MRNLIIIALATLLNLGSALPAHGAGEPVSHGYTIVQPDQAGVTVKSRVPGSQGSGQGGGGSSAEAAEAARREAARLAACDAYNERIRLTPENEPTQLCRVIPFGQPAVNPETAARAAILRLPIPAPEAKIGPDPSINEWNMAAVGYPLWLWVEGPDHHQITTTEQGITLTLTARRISTGFDLDDGTVTWCAHTPPWYFEVTPGTPSPGCGHTYQTPSLPDGTYAVTATTRWRVDWTALGQSGTLPYDRTGPPTQLPVGELVAVRTR